MGWDGLAGVQGMQLWHARPIALLLALCPLHNGHAYCQVVLPSSPFLGSVGWLHASFVWLVAFEFALGCLSPQAPHVAAAAVCDGGSSSRNGDLRHCLQVHGWGQQSNSAQARLLPLAWGCLLMGCLPVFTNSISNEGGEGLWYCRCAEQPAHGTFGQAAAWLLHNRTSMSRAGSCITVAQSPPSVAAQPGLVACRLASVCCRDGGRVIVLYQCVYIFLPSCW